MNAINQLKTDIKGSKIAPIYFLMGEESYYIDILSDYIESHVLAEEEKGFNQMVLYGKDVSIQDIVSNAKRYPMMADRQVIIVKEAQNLSKTIEQLVDYAKNPQPTTVLVFNYKYKTLDKRKALYKTLSKSSVVFESKKIYDDKIPSWIQSFLSTKQLTITPKACLMLAEFLGNDLSKIANELHKLALVVGSQNEVTPDIIEENIGISKDYNNFELQKAIGHLDHKKAYQIVNYFAQNSKQHPFVLTISILYMYFSKLMKLHTVRDKTSGAVAKALGVNPYFVNEYITVSRNFPMKRISGILETLRIYDTKSKGVGANLSPRDLYNELIYNILK
ncbi:DNA polymerase III subunit delta [Flavobacteriaceae bacterium]|jgi:DNA polymerase-3 subunit delta|nr:DNA polymerase III subunit delta [Flavobacteriaceae bacterium]MDC1472386.1 DNA polymerase III subunit delta [Flavobacteriaceae bacterium]MDC1539935.1 DNA polymerase III subunit delta [Flavobacteriaceae bacterium]